MPERQTDYDSPWKDVLERFFPAFMAFFFPDAHADIDWAKGYEFLDTELQQVVRDADLGRRYADKLARVYLRSGEEARVMVHVEIQGQREAEFEERMYTYNYRLFDYHGGHVVSLAVLADAQRKWRPTGYRRELWGCEASLRFPVVKLLDYQARREELEVSTNPFATVVLAHLDTQATKRDDEARFAAKWRLVRRLFERRMSRADVLELLRFIDWVMELPAHLEQQLRTQAQALEGNMGVPYVTSWERMARAEGVQEGLQEGLQRGTLRQLLRVLRKQFGEVPEEVEARLHNLEPEQIEALTDEALDADSLEAFVARIPPREQDASPA